MKELSTNHNTFIKFNNLNKYKSLLHFSTTINGGFSTGNYESFNLGLYSGDNIESVDKNRKKLCSSFNIQPSNLFLPYQTHSDKICVLDKTFLSKTTEQQAEFLNGIDALITNQKNICIGVTTADCVPVLLYDPQLQLLAAIHSGWRGTVSKIVSKTIKLMINKYSSNPSNILVGIAPSISQKHFEVGEEVVSKFKEADFNLESICYVNTATNKPHINLQKAIKQLCITEGIMDENIEISKMCTYANSDLFFSARRQTIHSGRMVTGGILLP